MSYPFRDVETKWQQTWEQENAYKTPEQSNRPKSYVLEMFPYPSGKLHMGHVRNYAIGDAIARLKRLQGYDVLHPMGWDAFGLPAENAAIQGGVCPEKWTLENIEEMKNQFKLLSISFDWERELATCLPDYYGHEQKFFLDFYKQGLAYRRESWVNWDPVDNCVLANEQVISGKGWRSGATVEKRKLMQWSLKITDYAQELLDDLSTLTGWPEKVVKMQENWIGRSEGALINFEIDGYPQVLSVFTTRPETLFGASFCGIAPTHPIADEVAQNNPELAMFIEDCQRTPTTEEALSTVEKKGYDTGLRVKHPFIKDVTIPLYVANFVLMDYGTGAIFACPAHDERDFDFATAYGLPIRPVVMPEAGETINGIAYTGPGTMINSEFLNGLDVLSARRRAIEEVEKLGMGQGQVTFRLRDWSVSRQRYWGCPIPIIYCDDCGIVPVPEKDLPVKLPMDVTFDQTGNPLDYHPTWKHTTCPLCQGKATRETDTLDTFFESSWYFLRFCDTKTADPLNKAAAQHWMPVDAYIGGIEHAVLHLLYARFFTKALRDCGYVSINEPFKNLLTQGMVCHSSFKDSDGQWLFPHEVTKVSENKYISKKDGMPVTVGRSEKMSKSKKNVVDPKEMIDTYGVDAVRLFVMSDTPPEKDFEWSDEGLEGAWRYLNRLWRVLETVIENKAREGADDASLALRKIAHQTIDKFVHGYGRHAFNKVIAFARELTRTLEEACQNSAVSGAALIETAKILMLGLNPLIPHLTSEMWKMSADAGDILQAEWPVADPDLAVKSEVTIAVQVNGKMRGSFQAAIDTDQETLFEQAKELATVHREIDGKTIRKTIVVPNRIVNIVV
ncbi:leucine--tRNA ligase [Candidatus Odyssella acanthamoebae]|uniref:Leucine--tRNA ligase n=1 Tax=Candidatus Odyssella acanthamoebae TaxID=91604 RepID=A0A077AUY2_9PROT|nr:leucine--tRNA ligase [Candidatus Paracaedibacter acanthamoebae]AIK96972.1 leucyl-tRNA synthetase [Candidatus Paracaedibacter acanthamoebae]